MNSEGSPSEIVAAGYVWTPGTELVESKSVFAKGVGGMKSTGAQQVMGNRTGMQTTPELAEELVGRSSERHAEFGRRG